MKNLYISTHAVVKDRLARLRDKSAPVHEFRRYVHEVSRALAYEASADLPTKVTEIETPVTVTSAEILSCDAPVLIVPILRAGLGFVAGLEALFADAHVGHIGLFRDEETKQPVEYLVRLPKNLDRPIFVVDPMVATGHSIVKAVDVLLEAGAKLENIRVLCLIAAPEGVSTVHASHPDLRIYTAALDECLNDDAFIVPGLGDAGDRMFGTL